MFFNLHKFWNSIGTKAAPLYANTLMFGLENRIFEHLGQTNFVIMSFRLHILYMGRGFIES